MKKILVLGAGFLQDFIIQKVASMGYETHVIDANPNSVGFLHADKHAVVDIVNERACLEYAEKEKVNGVITVATDFGVLSAAYVAEKLELPGLNYETAKLIKNKYKVRKCLIESQIDKNMQAYEVSERNDISKVKKDLIYPLMVKPFDGSGSRGTSRVDFENQLFDACEYAMSESITHHAYLESFIFGKEYGAESIVIDGTVYVLAIIKKKMTLPPYYAELGHVVPCGLTVEIEQRAKDYVKRTIEALGINFGAVNIDMLITNDGEIHIVDIGARMGGNLIGSHIVPYGIGIDYMGAIIKSAMGERVSMDFGEARPVASNLIALDGGVIKSLPDIGLIEKKYDVKVYHHMSVGMRVNQYHTNIDGCGYVVALGDTAEVAENKVDMALCEIKRGVVLFD